MNTATKKIAVGDFVRLVGDHDRALECGLVQSISDGTARFQFHFDHAEIDVPVRDLSPDTLVFWGL